MSSSGELTTERIGRPWSPMSATDLAHDDDDDNYDDDDDDVSGFFPATFPQTDLARIQMAPFGKLSI